MTALHPQVQAVMDAMARMNLVPPDTIPVDQARAQFMRSRGVYLAPQQPVASAVDRTLPGPGGDLSVRIYRPAGSHQPCGEPLLKLGVLRNGDDSLREQPGASRRSRGERQPAHFT